MEVDVVTTDCDGSRDLPVPIGTWTDMEGFRVRYCHRWPRVDYALSLPLASLLWQTVAHYDLVHVTSAFSFPAAMAAWACRGRRVPFVVSPRGSLRHAAAAQKRWKKAPYWSAIERPNLSRAAALHATSMEEARELEAHQLGVPVVVVPNGVTLSPAPEVTRHAERVLFLGRLHPVKAIDRLLAAMGLLEVERPGLELVLAGPDEVSEERRLRQLLAELSPRPRVRFLGPVHGEAKSQLLASAAVLVLPSHTENFGLVVVEALACGTPVVASRHTPWSVLEGSGAGRWVENTPAELAGAIRSVVDRGSDPAIRIAARTLAATYEWSGLGPRMAKMYEMVLTNRLKAGIQEA